MSKPVFIDEWRLEPQVWDRVRIAVDANPLLGGQYILAGSAGLAAGIDVHTGAGRIVSYVMRPMSMVERAIETPTVTVSQLLQGQTEVSGTTMIGPREYVDEILKSGFPGIRDLPRQARERQLDGYLSRIVDHDMPENGMRVHRPNTLYAWLKAYAAVTATQTEYTKILDAATPGQSDKPARETVNTYREHLKRLFILDPLESWQPTFSPLNRLTYSPKHHIVDPALAAHLLGISSEGLLRGEGNVLSPRHGTRLGALIESLSTLSVRTYASALGAKVGHLRTKCGEHEIDLIVEQRDSSILALEVKLADTVTDKDVKHLLWLRKEIGDRFVDGAVIYTGPHAYRRADGIAVIPLALLGA